MQLRKTLHALLVIQILAGLWFMLISYSSAHSHGSSSLEDIPIVPMFLSFGVFILLCVVNVILLAIHISQARRNNQKISGFTLTLMSVIVLLAFGVKML